MTPPGQRGYRDPGRARRRHHREVGVGEVGAPALAVSELRGREVGGVARACVGHAAAPPPGAGAVPGAGQGDAGAQGGGLRGGGVGGGGLAGPLARVTRVLPGQAVPRPHLVPVSLIVNCREYQDVEDEETGPNGDGDAERRTVGGQTPLRQSEVAFVLWEGRGGRDHHRRTNVVRVSTARGAVGQVPHHDSVRLGLKLNILLDVG